MPLFWIKDFNAFDARYLKLVSLGGIIGALGNKLTSSGGGIGSLSLGAQNTGSGAAISADGAHGAANNVSGGLTVTAGSTATAGAIARVTFNTAMISGYNVFLQMLDHSTAGPFPTNLLTTSFDISLATVTPGQTYNINYFVIQMI